MNISQPPPAVQPPKKRAIAYIDGFNLYYGICDAKFRRYLWLNLSAMVEKLLRDDQRLVCTKYFTTRISGGKPADRPAYAAMRDAKQERQATFLDALGTLPGLYVYYGHYLEGQVQCNKCSATWMDAEEKMTDVNIATEMLMDAFKDRFDVALLVSADSDLVPPIKAIKSMFPEKRINVAFPPCRSSYELIQTADGQGIIHRGTLKKCQFPDEIITTAGVTLRKPSEWV